MKHMRRATRRAARKLAASMVILFMLLQAVAPAMLLAPNTAVADDAVAPALEMAAEAVVEESDPVEELAAPAEEPADTPAIEEPVLDPSEEPAEPTVPTESADQSVPAEPAETPVTEETPAEPTEPAYESGSGDIPDEPTVEAEGEASTEKVGESEASSSSDAENVADWRDNGDGSMTIAVKEDVEYEFRDTGLRIIFTEIDEKKNADNPKEITVRIVPLSSDQVESLNTASSVAWEIVSTMENGTFKYDLAIPVPAGIDSKNVGLLYAENEAALGEVGDIGVIAPEDVTVSESGWDAVVNDLDHFTVFTAYVEGKTHICHATGNGKSYVMITPANTGALMGHADDKHQKGNDIIPPIPSDLPSGWNWTDENKKIWENDCNPPVSVVNVCGDGIVGGEERCDYGNLNGSSNCSASCQWVEPTCSKEESVANGGFEIPKVGSNYKWDIFDSSEVPGWDAKWHGGPSTYGDYNRPAPKIEIHAGVNGWGSADDQYVELDTDWVGPGEALNNEPSSIKLSQTIPTKPGFKYELSFDYAARPNHGDNRIEVRVNDEVVFDSGVIAGGSSVYWLNKKYQFTAEGDAVTVSFTETGQSDSLGMFLDDVGLKCLGADIPKYEGPRVCPKDRPVEKHVGTYHIDSRDTNGEIVPVSKDATYLFKTSGTFRSSSGPHRSDAGYTTVDDWSNIATEFGIAGTDPDYAAHALLGDMGTGDTGVIEWGAYDVDHEYAISWNPVSDGGMNFLIGDRYGDWFDTPWQNQAGMGDNEGSLSLDVYECRPSIPTVTVVATKIVCDSEEYLPDWGGSGLEPIDGNTATAWISDAQYPKRAEHCSIEKDWDFQWRGKSGVAPSNNDIGELSEWTTFSGSTEIALEGSAKERIEMREVLPDSSYIPFSGNSSDSAEFYCTGDTVNYDNWEWLNDPKEGSTYHCVAWNAPKESDVQVCKKDEAGAGVPGWSVGLAKSDPVVSSTKIDVSDGDGTDTSALPSGKYLVKVDGTYRYGNSSMTADAGYSYRPKDIREGCDCWKSGTELSIPYALMVKVNDQNTYWGAFVDDHSYFTIVDHAGGAMNVSIFDDHYGDNENNGNLRFEVYAIDEGYTGLTGDNGCVTFENVPYGNYELGEAQRIGWEYVSGAGDAKVDDATESFTLVNEPDSVTVVATKIVCDSEEYLPNRGSGGPDITATTATDWIATTNKQAGIEVCRLVRNWDFQWSLDGVGNPGDNKGDGGTGWTTFGPTGANGAASVEISNPATSRIWLRESMKDGHVPFSGNANPVTAEMYCNNDVLNYDNWEWIDTAPGETYHCVAWNALEKGTIVIEKQTDPNGSPQKFEFDPSWSKDNFSLADGDRHEAALEPGTYSVAELVPNDWAQTSAICSDQSPINAISLQAGETVTCVFTNTKKGNITIVKDAINDDAKDFRFTTNFDTNPNQSGNQYVFFLDDDRNNVLPNSRTFVLSPGNYTVQESAEAGWKLTGLVCTDATDSTSVNTDTRTATLALEAGEEITCTFTNTKLGKIEGWKWNDRNGDGGWNLGEEKLNDWKIFIDQDINGTYTNGEPTRTTSGRYWFLDWHDLGRYSFDDLLPGTYKVCEEPQPGWYNSTPVCQMVDLAPGETKNVSFGNHRTMKIKASKIVCTDEKELPNWGLGGPDITASTAQNWVNSHKGCSLVSDWKFQWSYDDVLNPGDNNTGDPLPDWTTFGPTSGSRVAETEISDLKGNGRLWVREVYRSDYIPFAYGVSGNGSNVSAEMYCHKDVLNYDNWERIDDPRYDSTYHCVAWNVLKPGEVVVTKFEDVDGNGIMDEDEQMLSGWEMNLSGVKKITGSNGTTTFDGLIPGEYVLSETMQEGWEQTGMYCGAPPTGEEEGNLKLQNNGNGTIPVSVNPGEKVYCYVGNENLGTLTIEKTNDSGYPATKNPGDTVKYRLTITANDGKVKGVTVTDLPPEVAKYVSGSGAGAPFAKEYASPGVWDLGDLDEGETVTLTYDAIIGSDADAGDYPDLAFARGFGRGGDILAVAGAEGNLGEEDYVGTLIAIADTTTPPSVKVKTDFNEVIEEIEEREALPATGASILWIEIASAMAVLGSLLLGVGYRMRNGKSFGSGKVGKIFAAMALGMIVGLVDAEAVRADAPSANLLVRAEAPEPAANSSFILDFVVLDTIGEEDIVAECQVKAPASATFATFASLPIAKGGDSAQCSIGAAEMPDDGTYVFRIVASVDSVSVMSAEKPVSYDSTLPGRPRYIERDEKTDCRNEITFRTADDGQTVRIEVYRENDEDYVADASTKIRDVVIGPDTKYEFDDILPDSLCGKENYYAIRAFDSAGNASPIREEDVDEVVERTIRTTETVVLTPGVPTTPATGAGETPAGAGEETGTEGGAGTVAGEEAEEGQVEGVSSEKGWSSWFTWLLGAAIAAVLVTLYRRKKEEREGNDVIG